MKRRNAEVLGGVAAVGDTITIEGWVRTRRDSKAGLSFLAVHDGSSFEPLQVVAPTDLPNYEADVLKLGAGCAVRVTGEVVASQGKGQTVELRATAIEVVGWVDDPETYPMQPKRHTMEYLREVAHLRPRTNVIGAVTRVRHALAMAVHRFFHDRGFFWIHTPIITGSDAEGAGQMFRVSTLDLANPPRTPDGKVDFAQDFFGKEAHLTVSGQLNVETYCLAMSKVYTFGPTFRAENSNTRRHLSEFWMIEPEIAFADLADDAQLAEDFLKSIYGALLVERKDDLAFFEKFVDKDCIKRLEGLVSTKFARMTYTDAITALQKSGKKFEFPVSWGVDLQSEHERFLTEEVVKGPVAVTDYPKDIKAFYMRLNPDEKTVAAMDVLAPGIGEIIGGSQREERLDALDRRITEMNLDPKVYWWYRDLRRYGTVPHAGFGLGFERAIQYATGVENIRDVIPFPRAPRQADFLIADWPAVLSAVEAALAADGLGRPRPPAPALPPDVELAARCAVAAKFLAVSTPRSFAAIQLGARAETFVAAQAAWAPAREILTWAAGDPPAALATALAADIVVAAGPLDVPRRAIRGGTHLAAVDAGVALAPDLRAAAEVYDVHRLAAVVAGLVDGRQLDEITVLVCGA